MLKKVVYKTYSHFSWEHRMNCNTLHSALSPKHFFNIISKCIQFNVSKDFQKFLPCLLLHSITFDRPLQDLLTCCNRPTKTLVTDGRYDGSIIIIEDEVSKRSKVYSNPLWYIDGIGTKPFQLRKSRTMRYSKSPVCVCVCVSVT